MATATIGDTNRDGTLKITGTTWNHNGILRVTVVDLVGTGGRIGGLNIPAMRRLARTALDHPQHTRSSRRINTFFDYGCTHVTFAVSRLDR